MMRLKQVSLTHFRIRLFLVLATVLIYMGLFLSEWLPLRIQQIGGGKEYTDLGLVLKAAQCYREVGDSVYESKDCGYQYGSSLLRVFHFLNLDAISVQFLGGLLATATILTLLLVAIPSVRTMRQSIIAILAISSPGIWLLIERGNIDILVFLMTVGAAICVKTRYSFISIFLISASALVKFYTLPLLVLYVFLEKRLLLRLLSVSSLLVITPLILIDMAKVSGFPNPLFVAFGLPAPGLWLNFLASQLALPIELGTVWIYLIGVLCLSFSAYLVQLFRLAGRHFLLILSQPKGTPLFRNLFLFSSVVFLTCFFAGMNFNYRLIFLVTSILLVNKIFPNFYNDNWVCLVSFIGLWFTVFYFGSTGAIFVGLAVLANVSQFFLAALLMYAVYQTLELPSFVKESFQGLVSPRERH